MLQGVTKRGLIKETNGQVKKHVSQMSDEEIKYLSNKLSNLGDITISEHLQNKMDREIKVRSKYIEQVIKSKRNANLIIEYNEVSKYGKIVDRRVLLRDSNSFIVDLDGQKTVANLCVVVSIVTGRLVTCYYNEFGDNHDNINMDRYNEHLKVIKED